jgi:hypothetical protein
MFDEAISLKPQIIGVKDWVNNKNYAWNLVSNTETTY